jgi:hypothetical protein
MGGHRRPATDARIANVAATHLKCHRRSPAQGPVTVTSREHSWRWPEEGHREQLESPIQDNLRVDQKAINKHLKNLEDNFGKSAMKMVTRTLLHVRCENWPIFVGFGSD